MTDLDRYPTLKEAIAKCLYDYLRDRDPDDQFCDELFDALEYHEIDKPKFVAGLKAGTITFTPTF
jgi:hypothetical protein